MFSIRKFQIFFVFLSFCLFVTPHSWPIRAEYVLPYPSYMPGNKMYWISRRIDEISILWYWGNLTRIKYYQKLADKYLVEAKTLFEYKQYLLAQNALSRSDGAFAEIPSYLENAKKEGIDIKELKTRIGDAASEHETILQRLSVELPNDYVWKPEQDNPTYFPIFSQLQSSLQNRVKVARRIEIL